MRILPYPHGVPHQIRSASGYLSEIQKFSEENRKAGFFGVLLFASLGDPLDQWDLAHQVAGATGQVPLVAVFPFWEHPVLTARKIASFQAIHDREIAINWLTGISVRDQEKIGLELSKEDRYARLSEYIEIVTALLDPTQTKIYSFAGKYFQVNRHNLTFTSTHKVHHFVSGSSQGCVDLVKKFPFLNQITAGREMTFDYGPTVSGVGLGFVVRETAEEAKAFYLEKMSPTPKSLVYSRLAEQNTDSEWKQDLFKLGKSGQDLGNFYPGALDGYSELGFFVGDYRQGAEYFRNLKSQGIDTVLASLLNSGEVQHLKKAVDLV